MIHVDTNVIIDVISADSAFYAKSSAALRTLMPGTAAIGPLVYAELATGTTKEDLDRALARLGLPLLSMSDRALYESGQAFAAYRKRGGTRERLLADFLIGAHALIDGTALLTRDPKRYQTAFPDLRVIEP
ncbi:MAG: PIN domain-containing protein [Hyphomonadaceae bacterium]|nr:MAG: PilT protein domain-containing protein [Caulobacteraceae bacterium]MBT9446927.1 PIN domain-containing protein [Hyphomonadaceae bacterium]TPW08665.1 MAG: PilT protein domain-containing protein [Alphaproteobacteria bacterium]